MTNQIAVPKIGMTLSRELMPQFSADNIKGFISYLKTKGVKCKTGTVDTNNLKSTQSEFDADKITNIMFQNEDDRSNKIIVSNDDYVLDGHHRWLANHNKDGSTEAYIVDLPILELLRMSKEYLNTIKALNEEITHKEFGPMMDSFVSFASDHLGIKSLPKVRYKSPDEKFSSFGAYSPATSEIVIQTKNRHPIDVLRTLAHELVHHSQKEKGEITDKNVEESGKTGSHIENKANAEAGVIMRKYGKKNPKMFESGALVEEYLAEMTKMAPNRARYKALFYAGGPGSGKDYVAKETGYGHGLTEINSDHAFEHLLGKEGLSKTMPPEEEPKRTSVREKAKGITKTRQNLHLNARNGIIINTTGHDHEKIKKMKDKLEGMGYDTKMVFVNTSDAVSKQRNIARGQGGGRTVPEKTRSEYWKKAQKSIPHYKKMFGDENFHHVDNSLDLSTASKEEKLAKKGEFTNVFKTIRKWARSKPSNPIGATALEQKLKARKKPTVAAPTSTPAPKKPTKKTITSVVSPEVTAQAKSLGLKHWGSGFHGPRKKGPKGTPIITHKTVGDKLVRIRKTSVGPENIKEDLRKWFDPKHPEGGWKRINAKGEAIGPCAREEGEPKPKCMSNEKRAKLTKKERAAAVSSKRRNDPNPERKGKPINVSNFGKGKLEEENKPTNPELWARAKSLAKQKFDVYPSAYANGWASKWYKSKGGGWKSVNEEFEKFIVSGHNAPDAGDTLPGRTIIRHPLVPESKKQMKLVKKKKVLAQEDGILDTASGAVGLPVSDSIGPEFGVAKSPSLIGGLTGVSPMSQGAYMSVYPFGTYGIAEEKKTFTQLREGMDKFIAQGTVASQGYKDDDDGRVVGEESPAWQRKEGKNPEGGLNKKGVESYRRENPGSKLQTAVTTKPSKLKKGSKSWKRRKSFCARMGGMPGPMKDEKGRPTRKALSLRKWNCEE
jgi:hypothetical protein